MELTSRLLTITASLVGVISRSSSLTMVDLPEPDGPMKNTRLALFDGDVHGVRARAEPLG